MIVHKNIPFYCLFLSILLFEFKSTKNLFMIYLCIMYNIYNNIFLRDIKKCVVLEKFKSIQDLESREFLFYF